MILCKKKQFPSAEIAVEVKNKTIDHSTSTHLLSELEFIASHQHDSKLHRVSRRTGLSYFKTSILKEKQEPSRFIPLVLCHERERLMAMIDWYQTYRYVYYFPGKPVLTHEGQSVPGGGLFITYGDLSKFIIENCLRDGEWKKKLVSVTGS